MNAPDDLARTLALLAEHRWSDVYFGCLNCPWRATGTEFGGVRLEHDRHLASVVSRRDADLRTADVARRLVDARLAYYGYTPDEIAAMEHPVDHKARGCEWTGQGWACEDENGQPTHPFEDDASSTAEFVMWCLEWLALDAARSRRSADTDTGRGQ